MSNDAVVVVGVMVPLSALLGWRPTRRYIRKPGFRFGQQVRKLGHRTTMPCLRRSPPLSMGCAELGACLWMSRVHVLHVVEDFPKPCGELQRWLIWMNVWPEPRHAHQRLVESVDVERHLWWYRLLPAGLPDLDVSSPLSWMNCWISSGLDRVIVNLGSDFDVVVVPPEGW